MALIKCLNCDEIFDDSEVVVRKSSLGDDYMGTGPSWITEAFCPACQESDLDYDFEEDEVEDEEEEEVDIEESEDED